jgi:hypothetical protein
MPANAGIQPEPLDSGCRRNDGGDTTMTAIYRHAWTSALLPVLLVWLDAAPLATQGRRIVDVVKVGDATSEREHRYAGEGVTEGVADGRTFREVRGWLSYSMAVYEDTEVTLACTFRGSEGRKIPFDLVVEGRKIATNTFVSTSSRPTIVDVRIPFGITKGLTAIHVMLRAVDGPTPALLELRTVQEHLERPFLPGRTEDVPGSASAAF